MGSNRTHTETVINTVGSASAPARSSLAASWHRSMIKHGLDPARDARVTRLDDGALAHRQGALDRFRHIAQVELDRLYRLVGRSGCGVFLTDTDGVVLDRRWSDADQADFRSWGLSAGTIWSEAAEGTNGIGTCIAEGRRVIVHRGEHFRTRNIGLSCIGAPVYGARGELIAALDVSTARADHTHAMNSLIAEAVSETAARIEASHFRARHPAARILVADVQKPVGSALLAVDRDDIVIGATRAARIAFDLGVDAPIEAVPAADILGDAKDGLRDAQRTVVVQALTRAEGNASSAAKYLGISRATLYRRMNRLGINRGTDDLSQD